MALVAVEEDGAIGTIVLDHPEKRNALSGALIGELTAALDELRARSMRAVTSTADGDTATFSTTPTVVPSMTTLARSGRFNTLANSRTTS